MPELPEVETVRRYLEQMLLKPKPKKIKSVHLHFPKIIKAMEATTFIDNLMGQTFTNIDRYGKHLMLKLNSHTIISHLRMTGSYAWNSQPKDLRKHDHIEFRMTDGSQLVYSDIRKFSTMHLVKKGTEYTHSTIKCLGPEATNPDTFNS